MDWTSFSAEAFDAIKATCSYIQDLGGGDKTVHYTDVLEDMHLGLCRAWAEFRAGNANFYETQASGTEQSKPCGAAAELAWVVILALFAMRAAGAFNELRVLTAIEKAPEVTGTLMMAKDGMDISNTVTVVQDSAGAYGALGSLLLGCHLAVVAAGEDVPNATASSADLCIVVGGIMSWATGAGLDMDYILQRKLAQVLQAGKE